MIRGGSRDRTSAIRHGRRRVHEVLQVDGRLLDRLEGDARELIVQDRLRLVVPRDREISLSLNHEKARRQTDLEAPLFGVEPLLGELSPDACRFDSLLILLEPGGCVANLPYGRQLQAPQACGGLILFDPRPGQRRLPTIGPGKSPVRSRREPPAPFVRYIACARRSGRT